MTLNIAQMERYIEHDLGLLCFCGTCIGRWTDRDTALTKAVIRRVALADILAGHADPLCADFFSSHPYYLLAHL